jgi:hypothetical protein
VILYARSNPLGNATLPASGALLHSLNTLLLFVILREAEDLLLGPRLRNRKTVPSEAEAWLHP